MGKQWEGIVWELIPQCRAGLLPEFGHFCSECVDHVPLPENWPTHGLGGSRHHKPVDNRGGLSSVSVFSLSDRTITSIFGDSTINDYEYGLWSVFFCIVFYSNY